jgi:hypothetical protein
MNYLKAVFWDYPQLTNREQLLKFIQESKKSKKVYRWLLKRFLEHALVVDTLEYFSLQEIALSYEGSIPGLPALLGSYLLPGPFHESSSLPWQGSTASVIRSTRCFTGYSFIISSGFFGNMRIVSRRSAGTSAL